MFHTLTAMVSLTAKPVDVTFPKTLAVNDFYWRDPRGGFDLPMGHIQMLEYMTGQTLEGEISDWLPPALVPNALAGAVAERLLSMLVISEDLPMADNRIRLGSDGGIILDYQHNNLEGHERLVATLQGTSLDGFVLDHAHRSPSIRLDLDSLLPALRHEPIRTARCASAPIRRARSSIPSAKLTNSTTSMWSTPRSSSAPGR